jgi:hypothetical protein
MLLELGIAKGQMPAQSWNLRKADFHRADLTGADLSGDNLRFANLSGASLRGANLIKTDLRFANLSNAFLSFAVLTNADLHKANLRMAKLAGVNFRGTNLSGADLSDANLREADIEEADLTGANLSGAYLGGTNLRLADLRGANFIETDLSGADLSGANITSTNKVNWIIKGIKCTHVTDHELIAFKESDDFEKKYTQIEKILSFSLKLPLSGLSFITGQVIEQALNDSGDHNIKMRSVSALSDSSITIEYISFDDEEKKQEASVQLDKIEKKLDEVISKFPGSNEDQLEDIISMKKQIGLSDIMKGNIFQINTDTIGFQLTRHYSEHPFLKIICDTVLSTFK